MKNKKIILSITSLILLSGCNGNSNNPSYEDIVCNDGLYRTIVNKPDGSRYVDSPLTIQWCDDANCYTADTDKNGVATKELEAHDYDLHVLGLPENYVYNPEGYKATADNRCNTITLSEAQSYSPRNPDSSELPGTPYNPYIVHEGAYVANITTPDTYVYFGFRPNRPGTYTITSWTENTNWINNDGPSITFHGNADEYVNVEQPILVGEKTKEGSKNFVLTLNIPIEQFLTEVDDNGNVNYVKDDQGNYVSGGAYIFGITCPIKKAAKTVPFNIERIADYSSPKIDVSDVEVTASLSLYPNKGERDVYKEAPIDGTKEYVYNESDGFYHVDSIDGPTLVAIISKPSKYMEASFDKVQEAGNKALTLNEGTLNYTNFINEYAKYCNEDGAYGVTAELKKFLELYYDNIKEWFVSESNGALDTIIAEGYEWAFACGYYIDIMESYDKPSSGTGSVSDPYVAKNGTYYVELANGQSVHYSLFIQNVMIPKWFNVRTSNTNVKLEIFGQTYIDSEKGPATIVKLGEGSGNGGSCLIKVSSVNGEAVSFPLEITEREITVEPDSIQVGENTVFVDLFATVTCSFKAPNAGKFTVNCDEATALMTYGDKYFDGSDGPINFTVELAKDEILSFDVMSLNMKDEDFITFTVDYDSYVPLGQRKIINVIDGSQGDTYRFKAPEDGTYELKLLSDNGIIIYRNELRWSTDDPFTFNMKADDVVSFAVATDSMKPEAVAIMITKI